MKRDLRAFVTLFSGLVPMLLAQQARADEPGWEQMPGDASSASSANAPVQGASTPNPSAGSPSTPSTSSASSPPSNAASSTNAPPLPPGTELPPPALPPPSNGSTPPGADAPASEEGAGEGRALAPSHVDVRAGINTNPFLHYIGIGLSADVGAVRVGPGTLAVGGGLEHAFCGSTCWTFSAATPMDFTQSQTFVQARASYHIGMARLPNVDFYPLVAVGPVFARSTVEVEGGLSRYTANDTAIGVAMGAGASWFIDKRWFVGLEGRARWAAGAYEYALASGSARNFDRGAAEGWSLNGLDATFTVGARLP